jgi:hypothetical protein
MKDNMDKKIVIFDLDGTLALIDDRRALSTDVGTGKMDWDIFFDPQNIFLDKPNTPVIKMSQMLRDQGFRIAIFSGRSEVTRDATKVWLRKHGVRCDMLKMRDKKNHFLKDSKLKQMWLDDLGIKDNVFVVFDDRTQVVDMWRSNGLTTFQLLGFCHQTQSYLNYSNPKSLIS